MEDPLALLDTEAAMAPLLDMAQESLSNKSTIRALVVKFLSHPDIFCGYDTLKNLIVEASQTHSLEQDPALLQTLDLFSYGVYKDYQEDPNKFLPLNETQVKKLRQLTLLTCVQQAATRGDSSLSYERLAEALHLQDQREMEQLLLQGIYRRTLNARLCQRSKQLLLFTAPVCVSRDVPLSQIPNLLQQLTGLKQRLSNNYSGLQDTHTAITQSVEDTAAYWKSVQEKKSQASEYASNQPKSAARNNDNNKDTGGTARLAGWLENVGPRNSSTNRQSKRSRGGLGGTSTDPFPRN